MNCAVFGFAAQAGPSLALARALGVPQWEQCKPVDLCEWFEPAPGFRARLWNAGHVLGSASVELHPAGVRTVLCGDIGPEFKAFHPDPGSPAGVDHVECESTYGGRQRQKLTIEERRTTLQAEVGAALARGGNLVIPTFALGRTQELLLDLAKLRRAGRRGGSRRATRPRRAPLAATGRTPMRSWSPA